MPRIFFGNFDFEHELSTGHAGSHSTPGKGRKPSQSFEWAWVPVAGPDDRIVAVGSIDRCDFTALAAPGWSPPRLISDCRDAAGLKDAELVPWGWTPSMQELAARWSWNAPAPPLDAVRLVNSRAFRFELEQELGVAPDGSAVTHSIDELEALLGSWGQSWSLRHGGPGGLQRSAIDQPGRGWILKANFGMSGRESVRGRGLDLPEALRSWARARFASSGPIVIEPLLDRVAEAGIQMEVPPSGEPRLIGVATLIVDGTGVYRGSRFGEPDSEVDVWQPAVETALVVARRVQQAGYFGPLGIDAMRFRDSQGRIRLRPLQDLNARYTMGRLALGFLRILPRGWCGSWMFLPSRALSRTGPVATRIEGLGEDEALLVPMAFCDSGPCSLLAMARSPSLLHQVERHLT